MINKAAAAFVLSLFCALSAEAKDTLAFIFPNAGFHKTECPADFQNAECFAGQNGSNFREMYVFSENGAAEADAEAEKHIYENMLKYGKIQPEYVYKRKNDVMYLWCSKEKNICAIERIFKGKAGAVSVRYLNRAPHYSQNIFGRQTNILAGVKVYEGNRPLKSEETLIELK